VNVRRAQPHDAAAVLAIYAPIVRETAISFEEFVPDRNEVARRIRNAIAWFVCEKAGTTIGYSYAFPLRSPSAYRWSVELTVYVHRRHRRKGVASLLLDALIDDLRRRDFVSAVALIALPNEASVGLFESRGFANVGRLDSAGYKLGGWWDVGWWLLRLNEPRPDPPEPRLKPPKR
jgi:phosphinothricin acetyltransferase